MVKKKRLCKLLYHIKCKRRGVSGQKKPNFVNVVCERPLMGQPAGLLDDQARLPKHQFDF